MTQSELDFTPPDDRQAREDEIQAKFDAWKEGEGGNWVMQELYRTAAPYASRYKATGQRVAVALLFEKLRDRIVTFKEHQARKGRVIKKSEGYSLNNTFRSVIARHMMDRRPDWQGMMETRERKVEKQS